MGGIFRRKRHPGAGCDHEAGKGLSPPAGHDPADPDGDGGGAPAAGRILWLAAPGQTELKIAQTKAEAGSASLRLFAKGAAAPAVPGTYLIADGKNSEIVLLRALEEEMGELLAPLARPHSRSRSLLPAQRYHTDGEGVLTAAFREPCAVEVCGPEGSFWPAWS